VIGDPFKMRFDHKIVTLSEEFVEVRGAGGYFLLHKED